jgi:2-polyprenyl-3-methyl-5-hydroxy-6-metoxy-1,4-benzoquinol methylase
VCGGTSQERVYRGTISPHDTSDPSIYFSSSRTIAGYLPIVRCTRCGLVMTSPRDDDATLARVYTHLADRTYEEEEQNRRHSARERLALVDAYRPGPGRLLDIGCATGIFVCAAQEVGWDAIGVDASGWAVAQAERRCPGAAFRSGLLEEIDLPAASFDVVTMWDLLEHASNPADILRRVRSWLVPGGWLFLSLPNVDSITARLMGSRWVLLLREHLWYFSPGTITTLLAQAGFELAHVRSKLVRFSLANIVGRLGQRPGSLMVIASRLSTLELLRRVPVRFPIGEMYVVARLRAPELDHDHGRPTE